MIPRVLLALEGPSYQSRLRKALIRAQWSADVLKGRGWDRLLSELCDFVLISRSRLPEPVAAAMAALDKVPDAPGVIVVGRAADADERAQLLACGVKAILDPDTSTESIVEVLSTLLNERREVAELAARGAGSQPRLADFVSKSPTMETFMDVVGRIVPSTVSLLILGETGVGKERLARAIHNDGPRSGGPFVAVNCGALPESLLESELFGHEEGAFTGASRARRGCFELAHGGTVFLDEIGEIPVHLQVKLLRVLQDREVRRVGGERTFAVDVRVMAATNRDLEDDVSRKQFRQDLYYRLSVMALTVPPLRERREDIPELVYNYLSYLRPRVGTDVDGIEDDALDLLVRYEWPGNVRELINVVERAMLLASGPRIRSNDLPLGISGGNATVVPGVAGSPALGVRVPDSWLEQPWREVRDAVVEGAERAYLDALLKDTGGRVGETARRAGMEPRSLYEKMKRHSLRKEDYRDS